jgi:hypothetical protein
MRRLCSLLAVASLALSAADPLFESAERKLDLIELRQAKRGSTVTFTAGEINAWARVKVPEIVPEGIRDQRVELGMDTATAYALMDFLKMRHAKGQDTSWLMTKLIQGERPVKIAVRLSSSGGRCTVYLTRVEVSNIAANQTVLEFLIKTFFMPLYPEAKINEAFDLDYDIDRIEIRPSGVRASIRR